MLSKKINEWCGDRVELYPWQRRLARVFDDPDIQIVSWTGPRSGKIYLGGPMRRVLHRTRSRQREYH